MNCSILVRDFMQLPEVPNVEPNRLLLSASSCRCRTTVYLVSLKTRCYPWSSAVGGGVGPDGHQLNRKSTTPSQTAGRLEQALKEDPRAAGCARLLSLEAPQAVLKSSSGYLKETQRISWGFLKGMVR